eukprot:TRINITY_DN9196_c0_g1_i1.p2 TRINITY_DN9196_c0_g1~~TRINITY_DN9196_c0_g1_i1.p2  ORF type:complete len:191 (+),score=19.92 TRINITY_DN9196_c0_g1_i1:71-574(+)
MSVLGSTGSSPARIGAGTSDAGAVHAESVSSAAVEPSTIDPVRTSPERPAPAASSATLNPFGLRVRPVDAQRPQDLRQAGAVAAPASVRGDASTDPPPAAGSASLNQFGLRVRPVDAQRLQDLRQAGTVAALTPATAGWRARRAQEAGGPSGRVRLPELRGGLPPHP